ncbi:MAG: ATP-binding protein [Acidobacteriota bacterium]
MNKTKTGEVVLLAVTGIDGRVIHFDNGPIESKAASETGCLGMPLWACSWCFGDSESAIAVREAIATAAAKGSANAEAKYSLRNEPPLALRLQFRLLEIGSSPTVVIVGFHGVDCGTGEGVHEAADRLLYGASHDLQDPLRMILIYAQLLQRRYGDQLDEEGRRVLGFVIDGARRMNDLIRSLLTYARLEANQPGALSQRNGQVSSAAAFEEALSNLRMLIEENNAEVIISDLPVVLGQHWETVLVFQNLLSNAIKYSKPTERPRIAVHAGRDGGFWKFSISDRGVGFPPQQAHEVFELFTRLHSHASGTGLGLSICKRIVERRGGKIWAESRPGDGSVFYFTLPAADMSTSYEAGQK